MIIKPREIPLHLLKLQALIRRTPASHPQAPNIQEQLSKRMAGHKGEHSIDYPLSFLPDKPYFILHDLRLQTGKHYFQMDSLVICKNFMIILEVKNIAGSLFFDHVFHQLIRTKDNQEETFPDPVLQVRRHQMQLKQWLGKFGLQHIPIIPLVVISNPSATIRTTPENKRLHQEVVRSEYLPTRMLQIQNQYKEEKLADKQIKSVIRLLQKHDQPLDKPILDRFNLSQDEIQKGVHCTNCKHIPMQRIYGSWQCQRCSRKHKDAYIFALFDYYLLIRTTITNAEARVFLQIESDDLAKRLLQSLHLPMTGENKRRVYDLSFDKFKQKL